MKILMVRKNNSVSNEDRIHLIEAFKNNRLPPSGRKESKDKQHDQSSILPSTRKVQGSAMWGCTE